MGILEGFPFAIRITTEDRLVKSSGDGGMFSRTLFKLENGRLVYDFTVYGEARNDYENNYYFIPGRLSNSIWFERWDERVPLSRKEYMDIRNHYGLNDWHWRDDTEKILVMYW